MSEQNKITRRSLFAGLGLAAVAGVAVKLATRSGAVEVAEPTPAEPQGEGYRLTEHVKKYYRTTTI
jgi:hypothetical protein